MVLRSLTRKQLIVDVLVAVAFGLLSLAVDREFGGFAVPLVFGLLVALAVRRLLPAGALALIWIVAGSQMLTGSPPLLTDLVVPAVLFTTARYGSPPVRSLGLLSVGAGSLLGTFYVTFIETSIFGIVHDISGLDDVVKVLLQLGITFLGFLALLGLPWVAGLLVRSRGLARTSQEAQMSAEREASRAEADVARAEREAARAEQDIAVEQERNRIARDMHDVVAHSLAVVIAQADGARYARRVDPDSVDDSLLTIAATAREALVEVRVLLGQLRHNQGAAPQPALGDLDRLLEQMRSAGLTINRQSSGLESPLGTNRQLAVFRIVQESLTNVLRHGDRARPVDLLFEYGPDSVTIVVASSLVTTDPVVGETHEAGVTPEPGGEVAGSASLLGSSDPGGTGGLPRYPVPGSDVTEVVVGAPSSLFAERIPTSNVVPTGGIPRGIISPDLRAAPGAIVAGAASGSVAPGAIMPGAAPMQTGVGTTDERRGGHGLAGMRERATLAGGSLVTRVIDGRFVIRATIPTVAMTQELRLP